MQQTEKNRQHFHAKNMLAGLRLINFGHFECNVMRKVHLDLN